MRKVYFVFIIAILVCIPRLSFAQDSAAYVKGASSISISYGFINAWSISLNSFFTQKFSASGPYILTYEYGISKKISVGLSGGYSKVTNPLLGEFRDAFVGARGSYHIKKDKKFDPYLTAGFGHYWFNYKNDHGIIYPFEIPTPLAISIAAGGKYYFCSRLGAYGEVGYVDGAVIKIGLTYKTK